MKSSHSPRPCACGNFLSCSPSRGLAHSSPDPQAQGCLGHTAGRQPGQHLPPLIASHRVCGCALDRAHRSTPPPPPPLPSLVMTTPPRHGVGKGHVPGSAGRGSAVLQSATSGELPTQGSMGEMLSWSGESYSRDGGILADLCLNAPAGQHAALAHYSRSTFRSTLPTHSRSFWT